MSVDYYEIKEASIPITRITISIESIILGQSANIRVQLFNDYTFIVHKYLTMSGSDYQNWGNNDIPYVINFVCTALGFTLA